VPCTHHSATFLLECVSDLRARLRERGSDLLVRVGRPEAVLPQLARATGAAAVYAHAEVTAEELGVERRVGAALESAGAPLRPLWGSTLHHVDDLPFAVADMPANYGAFRGAVAGTRVRAALPTPAALRRLPVACPEAGDMPTLAQLGVTTLPPGGAPSEGQQQQEQQQQAAGLPDMRGGETEALRRLKAFAARGAAQPAAAAASGARAATAPAAAGNGMYGANFSCNISPWLALGCISPRRMYEELRAAHGVSGARGTAATATATAAVSAQPAAAGSANNLNWLVFEARVCVHAHMRAL
jgi:deoxyribodipyrimidine photolyase